MLVVFLQFYNFVIYNVILHVILQFYMLVILHARVGKISCHTIEKLV